MRREGRLLRYLNGRSPWSGVGAASSLFLIAAGMLQIPKSSGEINFSCTATSEIVRVRPSQLPGETYLVHYRLVGTKGEVVATVVTGYPFAATVAGKSVRWVDAEVLGARRDTIASFTTDCQQF